MSRKDIISWIESINKLQKLRQKLNFDKLYDIELIEDLESDLIEAKSDKTSLAIFYDTYVAFCKSINNNAKNTSTLQKLNDSYTSVSELIFLLDLGFDIAVYYLKSNLNNNIKKKLYDSQIIYEAYTNLDNKKITLMRTIDPFDRILSQMENFEKWTEDAYEIVEALGIAELISFENFEEKISSLNEVSTAPESKSIIKESLYKILEEKNMCITINFNENYTQMLNKIANIFPTLNLNIAKEKYLRKNNTQKIEFIIKNEKISVELDIGSLHKDLVGLINPLLEKHTGRCLIPMPTVTRQVFIVVPSSEKKKILGNKLLFYSN